jgi:hypothetical protein
VSFLSNSEIIDWKIEVMTSLRHDAFIHELSISISMSTPIDFNEDSAFPISVAFPISL